MNAPENPIQPPVRSEPTSFVRKMLYVAIALILLSAFGSYILLYSLGFAVFVGASAWIALIVAIVIFSIAALLFFVIPGILILLFSLIALGAVIVAIVLFPIFFPIIVPILILLVFLAIINKSHRRK